jgi:thiamine pyrophosphate-dependent acetolactate synthase large subunit-like protein
VRLQHGNVIEQRVPSVDAVAEYVRAVDDAAATALEVKAGVVVLAIEVSVWGAKVSSRTVPAPSAWKAQAERAGKALEVRERVELVWKE